MTEPNPVVTHLQAAFKELLAAARAALEAVDDLVDDPTRLRRLFFGDRPPPQSPASPKVEKIDVEGPGEADGQRQA